MKCSFCEQPLVCKACKQPFHPREGQVHLALYQPDVQVHCPECRKVLICKACGFVYGQEEEDDSAES